MYIDLQLVTSCIGLVYCVIVNWYCVLYNLIIILILVMYYLCIDCIRVDYQLINKPVTNQ